MARPWPDGAAPSAEQFLPWFDQQTPEDRLTLIASLLAATAESGRCVMLDHDGLIDYTAGLQRNITKLYDSLGTQTRFTAEAYLKAQRWRRIALARTHRPRRVIP